MSDSPGPDWDPGEFINHVIKEIMKDDLKLHQPLQPKWLIFLNASSSGTCSLVFSGTLHKGLHKNETEDRKPDFNLFPLRNEASPGGSGI